MFNDLRFGIRMLRRSPAFTCVAVLSLALGIGANTAIFGLIDTVMLRMMPVQDPARLVQFVRFWAEGSPGNIAYPLYEQFRDHNQVFSGMFAHGGVNRREIILDGQPELVQTELVSGSYFSVLGVHAIEGRTLSAEDDRIPGGHPVAVISYNYWKQRFALEPSVVGKNFTLNGTAFTIVGVTPPEFFGVIVGQSPGAMFPMAMDAQVRGGPSLLLNEDYNWLSLMARLKPGVTIQQAQTEISGLFQQNVRERAVRIDDPHDRSLHLAQRIELQSGGAGFDELRRQFSQPLFILMGVVALVLLIACANVANLLLARTTARQQEIAVRLAIGAGRGRLVRQLLTESTLLSFVAAGLGVLLAYWFDDLLVTLMSNDGTRIALDVKPDFRILGFTAVVSVFTSLLFGLTPALQATRTGLHPFLRQTRMSGRHWLSKSLVVSQVALSLVLLIGAALFARTLANFYRLDAGFNRENVLLFSINAEKAGYKEQRLLNLYELALERLNTLPGARSATLSWLPPISGGGWTSDVQVEGYTPRADEDKSAHFNQVAPKYFQTLGTPLQLGREFNSRDGREAPKVAIVNQSFARYYFSGGSPIGKQVNDMQIVGVVKDAKYRSLRHEFPRTVYVPYLQLAPLGGVTFAVRTEGKPASMARPIQDALQQLDRALRVSDVRTLAEHVDRSLLQERLLATLSGFFGLLALLLACIGLYGVMAYAVAGRTQEIGIRMALGAQQGDVLWLVLREVVLLLLMGIVAGLPVAVGATRLIAIQLFGITPTDPQTLVFATTLLTAIAAAAGYLPARRAAKVDPMVALRYE